MYLLYFYKLKLEDYLRFCHFSSAWCSMQKNLKLIEIHEELQRANVNEQDWSNRGLSYNEVMKVLGFYKERVCSKLYNLTGAS